MSDILVTSPYRPFTLPNQFKAVFNGYIYCGTVDAVDPSVSQVQVYLANDDGGRTPVAQPLRTNAGGFLVYNGQPAKFVTDSNHSLLVRDSLGNQLWYAPDVSIVDPDTAYQIIGAQALEALRRSYAEVGCNLVAGSFEAGGILNSTTDVLLYEAEGIAYAWVGTYAPEGKSIPADSTPYSTGGVSVTAWSKIKAFTEVGDVVQSKRFRIKFAGRLLDLVAWDDAFASQPRQITAIPSAPNQYGGYDVVTSTGTFEFITPTAAVMRGKNGYPTATQYINPIGWGAVSGADCTTAFHEALRQTGSIFVSDGKWILTDKIFTGGSDLRIQFASKNSILVNNVPEGVPLIEFLNTGTSYSVDLDGGRIDSVTNKNLFLKHRLSVLSIRVNDMDYRGGYQLFDVEELYGNPSFTNIHVRNLTWDAPEMAGSFVLRAVSCNTLSCDNWSVTGAYDDGIYCVQSAAGNENWNNSFTNITIQGRGADETFGIRRALTVVGGSAFVRNFYTEKKRPSESYPIRMIDCSAEVVGMHIVRGSALFTTSRITLSAPDLISVAGTGPEVTQFKSDNSTVVVTSLNNFNDYTFRFDEPSSGKITVLANKLSVSNVNTLKTPINAGVFGTGVTMTDNTDLSGMGLTGAVKVDCTAAGQNGIKFAIPSTSAASLVGEKYTIVARIKIVSGGSVSIRSIPGFSGRNPVIPCATYQDKTGEWLDILFHGTINNSNGAACAIVMDGPGSFLAVPFAYAGHVST